MLSLGLKRLVLAAALAVMPLQGVAATLSVLLCHGEPQAHTAHSGDNHHHAAHENGRHDPHQGNDGNTGSSAHHLCCHFTVTAPAAVSLPVTSPAFAVLAFIPAPLHDLFVPDRPQRPPLA